MRKTKKAQTSPTATRRIIEKAIPVLRAKAGRWPAVNV
jgi:hypothetical protein